MSCRENEELIEEFYQSGWSLVRHRRTGKIGWFPRNFADAERETEVWIVAEKVVPESEAVCVPATLYGKVLVDFKAVYMEDLSVRVDDIVIIDVERGVKFGRLWCSSEFKGGLVPEYCLSCFFAELQSFSMILHMAELAPLRFSLEELKIV